MTWKIVIGSMTKPFTWSITYTLYLILEIFCIHQNKYIWLRVLYYVKGNKEHIVDIVRDKITNKNNKKKGYF